MKKIFLCLCALLMSGYAMCQLRGGRITVSENGHYLQHADGTPFFWLADTGWELFHRLTLPEIRQYLDNRAQKGFTVIQAVVLAEFDGLRIPNRYGRVPFKNTDPSQPDEQYFALIDSTIKMAAERNLVIALLPTWGDKVTQAWGAVPVIFNKDNAYGYGKWIGARYRSQENVVWILGGDRPAMSDAGDWRPVWRAMAAGIQNGTAQQCFIAYHPAGGNVSTSQWFQQDQWLNLNMFQSGHGGGHDVPNWEVVKHDWHLSPVKPVLDAEPNYEDHPVNPWPKWNPDNGYFRDYDVRKQLYRSVFAGACGVTYGHHAVWQFMGNLQEAINYPDRGWINALDRPGAFQAGYLRKLIDSVKGNRVPDSTLVPGGLGEKGNHLEAFRNAENTLGMIYLPVSRPVTVDPCFLTGTVFSAAWFNPRTGSKQPIHQRLEQKVMEFTPPESGEGIDWVLVIAAF